MAAKIPQKFLPHFTGAVEKIWRDLTLSWERVDRAKPGTGVGRNRAGAGAAPHPPNPRPLLLGEGAAAAAGVEGTPIEKNRALLDGRGFSPHPSGLRPATFPGGEGFLRRGLHGSEPVLPVGGGTGPGLVPPLIRPGCAGPPSPGGRVYRQALILAVMVWMFSWTVRSPFFRAFSTLRMA